jgi:hypothetical protein
MNKTATKEFHYVHPTKIFTSTFLFIRLQISWWNFLRVNIFDLDISVFNISFHVIISFRVRNKLLHNFRERPSSRHYSSFLNYLSDINIQRHSSLILLNLRYKVGIWTMSISLLSLCISVPKRTD